ncbi:MAG: polysaccharide deacetylase family protein [Limnohabitans sp.]|nr:polysaccharide deacetylase family protein [Limnohabitans sp.]
MFYWIKTNKLIKWLFFNQIWSIPNTQNNIYLTFDDGPTPEITPWVLDILKQENIIATFFCIGKNIEENPEIFQRIIDEGHSAGNHSYNHINGWKTNKKSYLNNIEFCDNVIKKKTLDTQGIKLFRPPFGKITYTQSKALRNKGYKIIMWDVLTADFDPTISPEKCLENATKKIETGSIIVFHDSKKASKNLQYTLPKAIALYKENGFNFEPL